jgi:dUTPase
LYNPTNQPVSIQFGERLAQMEVLGDDNIEIVVDKDLFDNWEQIYSTERK